MNAMAERKFPPLVLGDEPAPHPELARTLLQIRRDKAVRKVARHAAQQLRHLCDITAFESFVSRAAIVAIEQGISPVEWLLAQVDSIKREQSVTREEHAVMAQRIHGDYL